jgi:hypothetical protein
MSTWQDITQQYMVLAGPYVVPPLALLASTFIFKFILSNRETRQYAKLLMNVMEGRLELAIGAEKSKKVLELWNDLVEEAESSTSNLQKHTEWYFLNMLENDADLTREEKAEVEIVLKWLKGSQDIQGLSQDSNLQFKLPKIPSVKHR